MGSMLNRWSFHGADWGHQLCTDSVGIRRTSFTCLNTTTWPDLSTLKRSSRAATTMSRAGSHALAK